MSSPWSWWCLEKSDKRYDVECHLISVIDSMWLLLVILTMNSHLASWGEGKVVKRKMQWFPFNSIELEVCLRCISKKISAAAANLLQFLIDLIFFNCAAFLNFQKLQKNLNNFCKISFNFKRSSCNLKRELSEFESLINVFVGRIPSHHSQRTYITCMQTTLHTSLVHLFVKFYA